jgi:ABC-type sugar transport system ATPase subunit
VPDLKLEALSKHFKGDAGRQIRAVDTVSLRVAHGDVLAIVGPSASGKTTLLRLVAGLETVDRGRIGVAGADMTSQPPHKRDVGMVFQTLALYPHMTAAQNMGLGLRLRGMGSKDVRERITTLSRRLGIADCLERRPFELSVGQAQRVALARALSREPGILLLDEPLSHLDGPMRRQLCRELITLHREFELTVLLVTHDLAVAEALGRRVAVMHEGRILQVDTLERLRCDPSNAFVADFVQPGLT